MANRLPGQLHSNLKTRLDSSTGVSDTFGYDNLNRLTSYIEQGGSVSPPLTVETRYDAARPNRLTNITLSAPAGAAALTGTRTLSYAFDDYSQSARPHNGIPMGNGNLMYTVSHDNVTGKHTARFETYTSFNMLNQINYANVSASATTSAGATADRTLTFTYGPEHQRIKQVTTLTGNGTSAYTSGTVWYLNGEDGQSLTYEKEIKTSGVTEHRHFLQAAGITFALATSRTGTGVTAASTGALKAQQVRYFQQDHLGSTAVITDEAGQVVERLAYDPWGKRRYPNGLQDKLDQIVPITTDRGYTEHEHLDEVGVIHMNGRVYDPLIGRFMSADPFIQAPYELHSHNRYAYVMNNPLYYTDSSVARGLARTIDAMIALCSVKASGA